MILMMVLTFALESEARKKRRGSRKIARVSKPVAPKYPAKENNPNFLNSCSETIPTVYNPDINNKMEGGSKNRMNTYINSVDDAATNGLPVTVAMDMKGEFGDKCNYSEVHKENGEDVRVTKRCLMLVHLPGLDENFPQYAEKFQKLPKDSFLALVEDTGSAFFGKGTGKMDIPFRKKGWELESPFLDPATQKPVDATLEVLQSEITNGNEIREIPVNDKSLESISDKKPACLTNFASRESGGRTVQIRSGASTTGVN